MKNSESPAMPVSNDVISEMPDFCVTQSTGLTKREMFAMNAMQGIVAHSSYTLDRVRAARSAVEFADALLEELDK